MRKWPIRWKIAAYAAALGVVATAAGACTTWLIMHYWEVAAFDRRLTSDANELFRDIENFEGGWANNRQAFKQAFVPLALRDRFIEVEGANNQILYLSPNLHASIVDDGVEKIHTRKIDNRRLRIGVFHRDGLTAYVGADAREVNQIGRDIVIGMFGAIPTVLIVVILGGRWVAGRAIAPVHDIRKAAERITAQNLDQRLPIPPAADEIAALIGVFNATLDRLQSSFEQSVRFSAEASHQLKTPISVLRAGVEEMLTDPNTPPKQQKRADELLHQIHQLTSIAENLLLLARADAGRLDLQRTEFDLCQVLDGICDDARALAEPYELTVETKMPTRLPLVGDRRSVALILQNLVENAVKYSQPGGCICIYAQAVNASVEVTVKNDGDPIPPERAPHIFERFYRARPDGRTPGPGLGLSIASELTKAHGGSLELVRSDSKWTEFRVRLPRA